MQTHTMDMEEAIASLERVLETKLQEAEQIRAAVASLKGMVVVLPAGSQAPDAKDYAGMGLVEAARVFLASTNNKPVTTRELADALTSKGWRTKSRNVTATIYATLTNAKKDFRRNDQGEWELKAHRG